jgi:hypothetical protein
MGHFSPEQGGSSHASPYCAKKSWEDTLSAIGHGTSRHGRTATRWLGGRRVDGQGAKLGAAAAIVARPAAFILGNSACLDSSPAQPPALPRLPVHRLYSGAAGGRSWLEGGWEWTGSASSMLGMGGGSAGELDARALESILLVSCTTFISWWKVSGDRGG